jgi:NAD+ kinase
MVAPSVPCTLITPVAPQSLSFRPLVVPETAVIEVHLPKSTRARSARQVKSLGLMCSREVWMVYYYCTQVP